MMLNICRLLLDIYIMIAFIGICFEGARASSHAFFNLRASVSAAFAEGEEGEVAAVVVCCCCC